MAMYLPSLDCNRRYVLDGTLILSKTVYDMCVVFTEGGYLVISLCRDYDLSLFIMNILFGHTAAWCSNSSAFEKGLKVNGHLKSKLSPSC